MSSSPWLRLASALGLAAAGCGSAAGTVDAAAGDAVETPDALLLPDGAPPPPGVLSARRTDGTDFDVPPPWGFYEYLPAL